MQNILSIIALAIFISFVAGRAITMRRKGKRAMVFGKTDKSDFLLILIIVWIIYPVPARAFGLPMWDPLVHPFWESTAPGWVGIALCAIAIAGLAASLKSFGDSFRVGIDVDTQDKLVTTGMFAISRNPLYLCIILFLLGMLLIHRNIVITAAVIAFMLVVHRQILREEVFLTRHYGAEFVEYCKKVRRYL